MAIGNLSATKPTKAIKTGKIINVSIGGKTIVLCKFLALYSCRTYPGSLELA